VEFDTAREAGVSVCVCVCVCVSCSTPHLVKMSLVEQLHANDHIRFHTVRGAGIGVPCSPTLGNVATGGAVAH